MGKLLKNIIGRIWAVWGMISFIGTFLIFFIPSMITWLIPDPSGQRIFINIARLWMRIWLTLVGCRVSVKGKEHFIKEKSFIVTCNHNSLMDIPLSSPFIPGPNKTIAKTSFAKIPLFGFYYMKGSILVNRHSEKSRRDSFEKMKEVLRKGMHMCIYPEGTRNRTEQPLKKFYDGAFKLAVATKTAVIPCVIFNTRKALPTNRSFFFWPTHLKMHFLPQVDADGKSSDELKSAVYDKMEKFFLAHKDQ